MLFRGVEHERFYFVHSYAARSFTTGQDLPADSPVRRPLVTWSEHGGRFVAAVENGRCRRRSSTPRSRATPARPCSRTGSARSEPSAHRGTPPGAHHPARQRRATAYTDGDPVTDRLVLLPAVDVADGQAVRLVQGEAGSETSYGDPLAAALDWQSGGAEWIHLVDLDAAFGRGSNAELLADVVGRLDVQVELSGASATTRRSSARSPPAPAASTSGRPRSRTPSGRPRSSRSTAMRSPSASTCAARRSPRAAGRRRAATCGRSSTAWRRPGARGTSSPT